MDRTGWLAVGALAGLLLAAYVVLDRGRAGAGHPLPPVESEGAAAAAPAGALTLLAEPAPVAPRAPLGRAPSSTGGPSYPPPIAPSPVDGDIAGVVVDAAGRPIGGAVVHLDVAGSDSIRGGLSPRGRANPRAEWPRQNFVATADGTGGFLLAGAPTAHGGDLCVTATEFPGHVHHQAVDSESPLQVVQFPEPLANDCTWIVEVVDTDGAPLQVDGAVLRYLGPTARGVVRVPGREALRFERGRAVADALPPGRWEIEVEAQGTFGGITACRLEAQRASVTSRLVLAHYAGTVSTSTVDVSPDDGLPWVDGTGGLARWAPGTRRGLGGDDPDQHFVATLRTGFGPVKGAELTLGLRVLRGMPSNDTLSLEYSADGTFRWQAKLGDLVPGGLSHGTQATVRLDLARLPLGSLVGLETLDLLPELADGTLDVVVQDDTAVDSITLRVAR
jgi:hypothetical protein